MAGRIRIGTAGWSYEDWKGIVYPRVPGAGFDPLALLASWFDLVELNVTFYRMVEADQCRSWIGRVADRPDFRFTAKLHRSFTHGEGREPSQVEAFRRGLAPLHGAGRLMALLLQFPWSMERTPEAWERVEGLLDAFAEWPRVVEVRHASWDDCDFRAMLREKGAALCSLDMPVARRSLPEEDHVTGPVACLRLHGRNYDAWFDRGAGRDRRYDYTYSRTEVEGLAVRARRLSEAAGEVAVVANNHFRGQAVATALALKNRLTGERTGVPGSLLDAHPQLEASCRREEPHGQRSLFP